MSESINIIIVGAGLIGLSTADALVSRGCNVTVIEARSGPACGTSYANSGMIHPSQSRPWGTGKQIDLDAFTSVHDLALKSRTLLQDKMISLGLYRDNVVPGCYKLFPDMMAAREAQKRYNQEGVTSRAVLDADATLGHSALYFEADLWANARDYAVALEADLKSRGAVFIYDAPNLRIRRGHDGVTAQIRGHVFQSDHIVIAAGPQSSDLLAPLNIDIPMTALRGFAVNFEKPSMALPFAPLMDAQSHSAMTIFEDHLRLSGTINQASARPLLQRWCELAPDIMRELKPATEIWSGLRPMSRAGRPYISETSVKGLWVNTGHGHMGWTLCAGAGELMAKMILENETDNRFALNF